MDSKMSISELIITIATNVASFIFIITYCIFYSWIITLQDLYSFFRLVFRLLSYPFFSPCQLSDTSNEVVHDHVSTSRPCTTIEVTRDDVSIVMEKLGLKNEGRVQLEPLIMSHEIVNMFDEREVNLDDVRKAFVVFDENNDAFVDAKELKRVMSSLGMEGLSQQECQRMIMAFDDDGDGRIDFGEFVKLIEENVCC